MATNPNYVKFMRGTLAAYNKLETKEPNTLYFLSDNDGKEGALYLGSKLIAGPDVAGATLLNELNDVMLTPGMDYDAILMYDSVELKWRDYSFDALTFRAETEQLKGAAGFVPAPSKDEHNKFLRGDGTWAIAGTECQIFNIETSEGQSHSHALAVHTGDKILNKGDIAIIQDFIVNGKFQYTSYVYNGNKEQPQLWCALDKEYNAKNVYLDSDIVFTNKQNIEETLTVSGKNLKEAFELVLERAETATLADAKTVVFDNNVLSLKDFGKRFYKYIPESGSQETNDYNPAHYILQSVDQDNPWKSGLEPKVVSENGVLVLGWYEPNPTTIEGLNNLIVGLRDDISTLTTVTSHINTRLDNTYTKEETNAQIAAAAHLKRKIVEQLDDSILNAADADQYIYMVPSQLDNVDNKYYEYIVIETKSTNEEGIETVSKAFERVGSWEVNLNDYATKVEVSNSVDGINTQLTAINNELARVDAKAEPNIITDVDDNFKIENKKLSLVSVSSKIDLAQNESLLNLFVQKETNKDLVDVSEIAKLVTVAANAERNIINTIDDNEFIITGDIERKLSIKTVSGAKVDLQANEDFKTVVLNINDINKNISTMSTKLSTTETQLQTINNTLATVNTALTNMDNRLDAVEQSVTWVEL